MRRQGPASSLRAAALIAAGSSGVHEGRYLIGFGHEASAALARQGHAYLGLLGPVVAVALALAAGSWIATLARPGRPAVAPTWRAASLALVAIYVVQESLEGALAGGHPAGIAAVFADGGWTALPLAVLIGGLIALLTRGARAAEGALHPWLAVVLVARPARSLVATATSSACPRRTPLARLLAGRGPPLAS